MSTTIADKWAMEKVENLTLSTEEIKSLYLLLKKLDPKNMDWGLRWFLSNTKEETIQKEIKNNKNFYKYAVQNFFSIEVSDFISEYFGNGISCLIDETHYEEFSDHSFIKELNNLNHDDLDKVAKLISAAKSL